MTLNQVKDGKACIALGYCGIVALEHLVRTLGRAHRGQGMFKLRQGTSQLGRAHPS